MRKTTVLVICLSLAAAAAMFARYVGQEFEAEQQAEREEARRTLDERREGLSRWIEAGKQENTTRAEQVTEPCFEAGFRKGFIGGTSAPNSIDFPISASLIETLAAREVEVDEVPAELHLGFLRGFRAGWDCGWAGN